MLAELLLFLHNLSRQWERDEGLLLISPFHSCPTSAIPITIGLTRGLYIVSESASSVVICYEILSGRAATRSIKMQLTTVPGEAQGTE